MESMNVTEENIKKIQALFPDAVTEIMGGDGKLKLAVDFDALKQELSDSLIGDKQERYQMTWPEKSKAKLLANSRISATLRPDKEKSVDFDTTKNLYIEGDNLDVLKLLRETYLGKIKMIYIDPPYNTGNDFIYEDDFSQSAEEYAEVSGDYDEQGNRLVKNIDSNGRFHTDWLNMIYPRLKVARDLLTNDGLIFISIDDNEYDNLKKLCDEIFGTYNYLTSFVWHNNKKGRQMDKYIKTTNEYIVVYAKSINNVTIQNKRVKVSSSEYSMSDTISKYKKGYPLHNGTAAFDINNRPNLCYTIYYNLDDENAILIDEKVRTVDGYALAISQKGKELLNQGYVRIVPKKNEKYGTQRVWRWGKEKFIEEYKQELILEKEDNGYYFYQKDRIMDDGTSYQKYTNYIDIDTSRGKNDLNKLFDNKTLFDFSKPVDLVKYLLKLVLLEGETILDFFSGSATTAHAVMQLNAEDGGNRKFIMVQLPEKCEEKSEAYKAGYKTICDIGEERIRRAGIKISQQNESLKDTHIIQSKEQLNVLNALKGNGKAIFDFIKTQPTSDLSVKNLDVGFRVLKLDSSNMQDVYYNPSAISQDILDATVDNIKADRTPLDLLFQVMLDLGVELSADIVEKSVDGKKYYAVNGNDLLACFDDNIDNNVITAIAKGHPLYAVFKDKSFATDSVGINNEQLFKTYSPSTVVKVI